MRNFSLAVCLIVALTFCAANATQAQNLYIPNGIDGTVSILNTTTGTVNSSSISVGNDPVSAAVTPDNQYTYVANRNDGTVSVIQRSSNSVTSTITVGSGPTSITMANGKAYVVNAEDGTISVIKLSTASICTTTNCSGSATYPISLAGGDVEAETVTATPDGNHVWVSDQNDFSYYIIDTSTDTVSSTVVNSDQSQQYYQVVFSPDSAYAYFTNLVFDSSPQANNLLSVVNASTGSHLTDISMNGQIDHGGLAITPDGSEIYALADDPVYGYSTVSEFSTTKDNGTPSAPINDGSFPAVSNTSASQLTVTPDGSKLYVGLDGEPATVEAFRTADAVLISSVTAGNTRGNVGQLGIVPPSSSPQSGTSSITVVGTGPTPLGYTTCGSNYDGWCTSPDGPFTASSSSTSSWPVSALSDVSAVVALTTINSTSYGLVSTGAIAAYNQIMVSSAATFTAQGLPCNSSGSQVTSGFPSGFSDAITFGPGTYMFQATNSASYSTTHSSAGYTCWQVTVPEQSDSGQLNVELRNTPVP